MGRRLCVSLAAAALLLAGCGGGGGGGTAASSPSSTYTYTPPSSSPTVSDSPSPTETTESASPSPTFSPSPTPEQTTFSPSPTPEQTTASPQPTATSTSSPIATGGAAAVPRVQGQAAQPGERVTSDLSTANTGFQPTMDDFLTFVITDVDQFWSGLWRGYGYQEPQVTYLWPAPGEVYATKCTNDGEPTVIHDMTAAYCGPDDQIAIGYAAAKAFWEGGIKTNARAKLGLFDAQQAGDFSLAYIVAHEYSHNLQNELCILPAQGCNQGGQRPYPVYKTELHADCWAGVWANSAYYKGLLEPGDVEEALKTALDIGNDIGADLDGSHGSPELRQRAFFNGYNSGQPIECDPWLQNNYGPNDE